MSLGKTALSGLILTFVVLLFVSHTALAVISPPGLVDPSACRVGAVLSTEQFISTGFSEVRTAGPNDEVVAGSWVVANNFVFDTSIVVPPNCPLAIGSANDGAGLNLMAAKITGTTESAQHADIESIKLVWDVNVNGMWEPLLDLVLQERPATGLTSGEGILFYNGPQEPLAILSNSGGNCIFTGQANAAPAIGVGPLNGTNSRPGNTDGCYISLLAIATIGDAPQTGTTFGLSMEAAAGDIPGTNGVSSYTISSGFSSSRNPQAANVRVRMFGGLPSSQTPVMHISNAGATAESTVSNITFIGGNDGLGLQTRFLGTAGVGSREVIALAVGLCDGGILANNIAAILPSIAGANITIAGGLASLPCVASANTDGAATGISGGKIIFRGTAAHLLGTVRVYADTDCDGILFEAGELIQSIAPNLNAPTDEAIAEFGEVNGPFLTTNNGAGLVGGCDATAPGIGFFDGGVAVTPAPMIVIVTVDVNSPVSSAQFGPGFIIQTLRTFLGFFFTNLRSSGFLSPYSGVMDLNPSSSDTVLGPRGGSFNATAAREDIINCFEKLKAAVEFGLADDLRDSTLDQINQIQQQFASGDHAGATRQINNFAVGFGFIGGFADPSSSEFAFILLSILAKLERLEKGTTLEEDIAQCLKKLRDALSDEVAGTDVANQVIELVASGDLDGAILLLDRLGAALDDEGRTDDADIALDIIFKLDELATRGSGGESPTSPNSLQEMFNALENAISDLNINPFTRTGLIRDVQDAAESARDGNTQGAFESTVSIRQSIPDLERDGILTPQEADALENDVSEIIRELRSRGDAPSDDTPFSPLIIECLIKLENLISNMDIDPFTKTSLIRDVQQITQFERDGEEEQAIELIDELANNKLLELIRDNAIGADDAGAIIAELDDILLKFNTLEDSLTLNESIVNRLNNLKAKIEALRPSGNSSADELIARFIESIDVMIGAGGSSSRLSTQASVESLGNEISSAHDSGSIPTLTTERFNQIQIIIRDIVELIDRQIQLPAPNASDLNNISLRKSAHEIRFRIAERSLENAQIQIFSTSGQLIYTNNQHRGNTLYWNLRNLNNQRVANGVYLYVITAVGANGKPITSDVKKLVVMR